MRKDAIISLSRLQTRSWRLARASRRRKVVLNIMADETTGGMTAGPADESNAQNIPANTPDKKTDAPAPADASVRVSGDMGTDIAKILKDVKLPERHDQKGSAEPHASLLYTSDAVFVL